MGRCRIPATRFEGTDRRSAYIRNAALPPLWGELQTLLDRHRGEFREDHRTFTEVFIAGCRRAHDAAEYLLAE